MPDDWRSGSRRILRLARRCSETRARDQPALTMPQFTFDPPLTLRGNVVVRNLDDAVRFMIGYQGGRRPALQASVLHRVEGAVGEAEERDAGYAFRGWAESERLIVMSEERPRNEARK